jgi:hypothetical protein
MIKAGYYFAGQANVVNISGLGMSECITIIEGMCARR